MHLWDEDVIMYLSFFVTQRIFMNIFIMCLYCLHDLLQCNLFSGPRGVEGLATCNSNLSFSKDLLDGINFIAKMGVCLVVLLLYIYIMSSVQV